MWLAVALFIMAFMAPPQKVVAVYQFGCIVDLSKGSETTIEIPIDEFGKERREQGIIIHAHVTLPPQGKGGTPAYCAYTKIVHQP